MLIFNMMPLVRTIVAYKMDLMRINTNQIIYYRYMVRTKARENRALSSFSSPSDSEDSSDNSVRVEMGKKATTSAVLTDLRTRQVPDRQVPCTLDGMWTDGKVHFIIKAPTVSNVFYYRDLTRSYSQYQPDAHPGPFGRG